VLTLRAATSSEPPEHRTEVISLDSGDVECPRFTFREKEMTLTQLAHAIVHG